MVDMRILVALVCVGLCLADDVYPAGDGGEAYTGTAGDEYHSPTAYKAPRDGESYGPETEGYNSYSRQVYHGLFSGKCEKSGFYYLSEYSFMMCSNENAYEQRCATGSKNSGYEGYQSGTDYYLHDFCDVNMVDYARPSHETGYDVNNDGYNKYENVVAAEGYEVKAPVDAYTKDASKGYESQGYETKEYVQEGGVAGYEGTQKGYPTQQKGYGSQGYEEHSYDDTRYQPDQTKSAYRGNYSGKCGPDGFYFNNEDSFVMCSNGIGYVQRCAPGSRNSGGYRHGSNYAYQDFCDVNLVDYGYGVDYPGYHGNPNYRPSPKFAH